MAITVGACVLDERRTVLREAYERVGGKETRSITITGLLRGAVDRASLDASLDAIMDAASESVPVYVSLREGRRILARREGFEKEVNGGSLTGQFVLSLRAEAPYEESETLHESAWFIDDSGATTLVVQNGNVASRPVISLLSLGTTVAPVFSDGVRSLAYDGIVEVGANLVVDGESGRFWLDGMDMTPYTTGDFPQLSPGETVLTYTDDLSSSHLLTGEVAFRDRWW